MAGHSKWHNIQHRKGRQDAKRGKMFTKATKEIMIAAKEGGGDPGTNNRLRAAIEASKSINLPKDKIELAIKKGTGEIAAESIDEIMYEGYGPGGVAILVDAATDNKNRTVADVRHILTKHGGSMGSAGCVAWMFDKRGSLLFSKDKYSEEELLEVGLEAGAEDIVDDGDMWQIQTAPDEFGAVRDAFLAAEYTYEEAELTMVPQNTVALDKATAVKMLKLYDLLEDNDDVQNVYANFDISDEILADIED